MRRFTSVGAALALFMGTLVPAVHAPATGKDAGDGFFRRSRTLSMAARAGSYVSQVATNLAPAVSSSQTTSCARIPIWRF